MKIDEKDRLKFRALVKGYYYVDTPDENFEFEPLIVLDNVDILNNGEVGLYTAEVISAIDVQIPDLNQRDKEFILEFFKENSNSTDNDHYLTIKPEKILQCTGRKDRNGELIFEGDTLRSYFDTPDGEEYEDSEVRYDYEELCWGLYTKKLNFMDTYGLGSEFSSKDHEILKHYGEETERC